MATFLPAKFACNSIRGSRDISIYVSFGHFLFWSAKCTTVRKKKLDTYKILLLNKNLHGFTTETTRTGPLLFQIGIHLIITETVKELLRSYF